MQNISVTLYKSRESVSDSDYSPFNNLFNSTQLNFTITYLQPGS